MGPPAPRLDFGGLCVKRTPNGSGRRPTPCCASVGQAHYARRCGAASVLVSSTGTAVAASGPKVLIYWN